MIKLKHEIAQRFTGLVRERRTIEMYDGIGQARTGCLEVALHAHPHLPVHIEARRVHNGPAYVFGAASGAPRFLDMPAAGTVTPLAIDAFRDSARKHRFSSCPAVFGVN